MRLPINHSKTRITAALLSVAFVSFMSGSQSDVIYGADTRQNYSDVGSQAWKKLARSTAAMVKSENLDPIGSNKFRIHGKNLKVAKKLCDSERFGNEPMVSECSGFLVAPDVIVTAGHCLKKKNLCSKTSPQISWVFELNDTKIVDNESVELSRDLVYFCSEVLKLDRVLDVVVIRLDRVVRDREPVHYQKSAEIKAGTKVAIIGNPAQLPTKISLGGKVNSVESRSFLAEVNSCYGSSGSAVISEANHLVLGLLVDGEDDWVRDRKNKCYRSKVCKPGQCSGETIVKISSALKGIDL